MKKPQRIALFSPFLTRPARGIERFSVELAKRLGQQPGYEVDLITWKESEDWIWGDLGSGVRVIRLWLPRYYRRIWAGLVYAFYLVARRPAVIQIFFIWHGEGLALKLVPWLTKRVLMNLHFPISIAGHRYEQIAKSGLAPKVARIVGVSEVVCRDARTRFGREVELVHNGVDLERFARAGDRGVLRNRLGIGKGSLVLSSVAALEERKNLGPLIRAFSLVAAQRNDVVLLIAGEGPERPVLENLISETGLQARVRLLGSHSKIEEVYYASDLFVFLGRGEAMPLAPIEAMACGLPVVSALYEPLPDLLCREGTLFVDAENTIETGAEILRLCGDPDRRQLMGRANRAFVEAEYSWDKTVKGYEGVYSSVIEEVAQV